MGMNAFSLWKERIYIPLDLMITEGFFHGQGYRACDMFAVCKSCN